MKKIVSVPELKKIVGELRKKKRKIVFTNGCFDIIHAGHIKTFRKAKSYGDYLIAGVNSDTSIRRLKGASRPIIKEKFRLEVLSSIRYIDFIVVFNELTPLKLVKIIKPDFLVKGGDYSNEEVVGRKYSGRVIIVSTLKGISTTDIIEKIKNEQCR